MANTIGYHLVKSCYGMWLPGDDRGSWSEAWDEQIGFIQPHTLNPADPVRQRMAIERQAYPAVTLDLKMKTAIVDAIGACVAKAGPDLLIAAATIETTHMHLLLPYTGRDIDITAKWLADQTTKAVHRSTEHAGPVWSKGRWRGFIYDVNNALGVTGYIERHNQRRGMPVRPYSWITEWLL